MPDTFEINFEYIFLNFENIRKIEADITSRKFVLITKFNGNIWNQIRELLRVHAAFDFFRKTSLLFSIELN